MEGVYDISFEIEILNMTTDLHTFPFHDWIKSVTEFELFVENKELHTWHSIDLGDYKVEAGFMNRSQ